MKKHIGIKLINAKPMTRLAYNNLRGWTVPADENPDDDGFLVEYLDGSKANHKDFSGYISWSPKAVFENAYHPTDGLTFGLAVEALKLGHKVSRAGWNGKGMWLDFVKGQDVLIHNHGFGPKNEFDHNWRDRVPEFGSWIGMKTADNKFVPWLASQTDVLAEDWQIVD
jgi:Protein of unknown function (DUF2829)